MSTTMAELTPPADLTAPIPPPAPPAIASETRSRTLTVKEFLAAPLQLPPPFLSFSLRPFGSPFQPASGHNHLRVTHSSSKHNEAYDPIDPQTLEPFEIYEIDKFRAFITSMSPAVTFPFPHQIPFDGCALTNEGDVTAYISTQVISAAWLAVLQMVPPRNRQFDLLTIRKLYLESGVPDQVFGIVRKKYARSNPSFIPCAIIELKAPKMVHGLLHVIQNRLDRKRSDPCDDWVTITKQLRKYAINSASPDVLVMDETTAIYFCFAADATLEFHRVSYVVATFGHSSLNTHNFTLRELVAFMCWRSLDRVGTPFRDFKDGSSTTVDSGYTSVLDLDAETRAPKRPPSEIQRAPKRKKSESFTQEPDASAVGWRVGELVTLNVSAPSRDSSYQGSLDTSSDNRAQRPFCRPPTSAKFRVTQVLTPAVAVLSPEISPPSSASVIAKIPYSSRHRKIELDAYNVLLPLQGSLVPYCYGTAKTTQGLVILTEFIAPGTTIAALRESGEWARIQGLQDMALVALKRIHELGVLHRDANGNNIVVCEGGGVVLVDFDAARVYDVRTAMDKAWEDRARVKAAFAVPIGAVKEEQEEEEQED